MLAQMHCALLYSVANSNKKTFSQTSQILFAEMGRFVHTKHNAFLSKPLLRASTGSYTAAIEKTPRKYEGVCDVIYLTAAFGHTIWENRQRNRGSRDCKQSTFGAVECDSTARDENTTRKYQ